MVILYFSSGFYRNTSKHDYTLIETRPGFYSYWKNYKFQCNYMLPQFQLRPELYTVFEFHRTIIMEFLRCSKTLAIRYVCATFINNAKWIKLRVHSKTRFFCNAVFQPIKNTISDVWWPPRKHVAI